MTDLNPELIAKAADAIDSRRHDFGFDRNSRPYCPCGWTAEEAHDVAAYDRHLAVAVLEAVAADLRAEGAAQAREQEQHRAPITRHRDAITGQYVTADEADNRPDTTVRETRPATRPRNPSSDPTLGSGQTRPNLNAQMGVASQGVEDDQ